MTHEADNNNKFAMSSLLEEYGVEHHHPPRTDYYSSVNRVKGRPQSFPDTSGRSEGEVRMAHGKWSNQDKQEWSCESCTFLNQPLFLSCEICGQPRLSEESQDVTAVIGDYTGAAAAAALPDNLFEDHVGQDETLHRKQDRIHEIVALQKGIYNRIRHESDEPSVEEPSVEELEDSFALMELEEEDALPLRELLAPTASVSGGSGKAHLKKPGIMDISNNTVSTAAMSSFNGSSRFSLDFSAGSHHSRLSRNASIPDQTLDSLKGESCLNRSSFAPSQHSRTLGNTADFLDYNALKASVEGASVRSFAMDGSAAAASRPIPAAVLEGGSNHASVSSFGMGPDSNHSLSMVEEESRPRREQNRRCAGMAPTLSSFGRQQQQLELQERESRGLRGAPRAVAAAAARVNDNNKNCFDLVEEFHYQPDELPDLAPLVPSRHHGRKSHRNHSPAHSPTRTDSTSPGARRSPLLREEPPPPMMEYKQGPVSAERRSYRDLPLRSEESQVPANARAYRSYGDLPPREESSPRSDDSPRSHGSPTALLAGLNATPKVYHHHPADANADLGDLRGSLHRGDGARKIPKGSMIPTEVKNSMASPRESVFSRNLYAEKRQEAAAKAKRTSSGGKAVGIPILNRMLQRKKSRPGDI